MIFLEMLDFPDMPFDLEPRGHHLMPASLAFESEIHSHPQYGETAASARMRLFHFQNITDPYVHLAALHVWPPIRRPPSDLIRVLV